MKREVCPLCGQRRARRSCPALTRSICAVCCGTKRLVEIQCPDHCVYLIGARAHPPAAVQRRQERDLHLVAETIRGLSEAQYRILMVLQSATLGHHTPAGPPLLDADVADAAQALAATLETADRGIIYDHRPTSFPGQRLVTDFKEVIEKLRAAGMPRVDHDAAVALRRMEAAARDIRPAVGGGQTAYLELLERVAQLSRTEHPTPDAGRGESRLIIP